VISKRQFPTNIIGKLKEGVYAEKNQFLETRGKGPLFESNWEGQAN